MDSGNQASYFGPSPSCCSSYGSGYSYFYYSPGGFYSAGSSPLGYPSYLTYSYFFGFGTGFFFLFNLFFESFMKIC